MTDDVVFLDAYRKNNPDRYENIDCSLLDLARLCDLAVYSHFKETVEERAISEFGPTCDFVLHEMQKRLHALVRQLWDIQRAPDGDPAA